MSLCAIAATIFCWNSLVSGAFPHSNVCNYIYYLVYIGVLLKLRGCSCPEKEQMCCPPASTQIDGIVPSHCVLLVRCSNQSSVGVSQRDENPVCLQIIAALEVTEWFGKAFLTESWVNSAGSCPSWYPWHWMAIQSNLQSRSLRLDFIGPRSGCNCGLRIYRVYVIGAVPSLRFIT